MKSFTAGLQKRGKMDLNAAVLFKEQLTKFTSSETDDQTMNH